MTFSNLIETFVNRISIVYPMRKRPITYANRLEVENIQGYFVRKVTKFGNSAKIDCPKEYIGRTVYVILI